MVNQIVAVGSVDGVLTGAAALRLFPEAAIEFTQAFMVDKLTPENWQSNRQVLFVDLAVNNQYEEMTIQFVTRVINSGHRIVGVNDEHDASAWQRVFDATGLEISNLIVGPCSQKEEGNHQSSGALLAATFSLDEHGKELCAAADEADHGNFSSHFASLANEAVKSNIGDNSRRVYLAEHFSQSREPDEKISIWLKEYQQILKNHEELIANREVIGAITRINATGKKIDMTSLMFALYALPEVRVVVIVGEAYDKELKRKVVQHSFGTRDKFLDLLATIQAEGINVGGFAQKANVAPEDADKALQAVLALLG